MTVLHDKHVFHMHFIRLYDPTYYQYLINNQN